METIPYGIDPDGKTVRLFTIKNSHGLEVSLSEYGATLTSMYVPDREGRIENIALGCENFEEWLENPNYFGSTVGRFGNRIAGGRFSLDGKDYELATNNDPGGIPCHLHGGRRGFSKVAWGGRPMQKPGAAGIRFTYYSDDQEEGYPGNLVAKVTYCLLYTSPSPRD